MLDEILKAFEEAGIPAPVDSQELEFLDGVGDIVWDEVALSFAPFEGGYSYVIWFSPMSSHSDLDSVIARLKELFDA